MKTLLGVFEYYWKIITSRTKQGSVTFWTWRLSPVRYAMYRYLQRLIPKYVEGHVLDVGAGSLLYKKILSKHALQYTSTDKYSTHELLDFQYDATDLKFPPSSFDVVFCNQMLEHVEQPKTALSEIKKVMKDSGTLIVGVPFFYYLHGLPHDYFRYTEYGLKSMLKESGFDIINLNAVGGYFSTLIEPVNIVIVCCGLNLPVWQKMVNCFNFLFFVLPFIALDVILNTNKRFPSGYFVVAKKRMTNS